MNKKWKAMEHHGKYDGGWYCERSDGVVIGYFIDQGTAAHLFTEIQAITIAMVLNGEDLR